MKKIIYFLTLIFLFSCAGRMSDQSAPALKGEAGYAMDESVEVETAESDFDPQPEPPTPPQGDRQTTEPEKDEVPKQKKIIKDGEMHLEVGNLQKAKSFVDSTLKVFGAYYENEVYESYDYRSSYRLKIRIPADNFEKFVSATSEQTGKVTLKNINTRDVTEEFYDVATRLENNESYLSQYRTLLKRANSIKDILEIQEKMRYLEEEMDSKKGRLKFINDQVRYSTLNLQLNEPHEWRGKSELSFIEKIGIAIKDGMEYFGEFILVVLRLWPFAILIGAIVFFLKRWRKKRKDSRADVA